MLVAALLLRAAALEGGIDLENRCTTCTCFLQLRATKELTASKKGIHPYLPYERKANLPCGMGPRCKLNGPDAAGYAVAKKVESIYRSFRFEGATKASETREDQVDDSICEAACNARSDCAGFLLSASQEHYSCDFLGEESIDCVDAASQDLATAYTCFKKTAGGGKYRAHRNRQYDRYDMASLFDYAYKSSSCEVDHSSSAQELVDQINTIRHVLDYRVGDVLLRHGYYWLPSRQNLMDPRYDGTALQSVLKQCPDLRSCQLTIRDFARELAAIGEARGFSKPDNETIVAYIRAGDVIDYQGYKVADKLRNPAVMEGIRDASLTSGYKRLVFVVVEAYADREEFGAHGLWMYSEEKHDKNREELLTTIQGLHEFLCSGTAQLSFGVVSPVNADETLFYLMHSRMLVKDGLISGFNKIGTELAELHNSEAIIM